jgi:hypothetical protein
MEDLKSVARSLKARLDDLQPADSSTSSSKPSIAQRMLPYLLKETDPAREALVDFVEALDAELATLEGSLVEGFLLPQHDIGVVVPEPTPNRPVAAAAAASASLEDTQAISSFPTSSAAEASRHVLMQPLHSYRCYAGVATSKMSC